MQISSAQSGNYWTQKASLPDSARESAVGFSINGKGYVGTGIGGVGYLWDFWEYSPVSDNWTQKADFTPATDSVGRRSAAGFGIGRKGYIGSGVGFDTIPPTQGDTMYNDFWEYDTLTDVWMQKNTLPTWGRQMYVAFSMNGKGYIGTGITGGFSGVLLDDFWEYDPTNDTWTQKANFGGVPRYQATGFSLLGKGYIGTGISSASYEYDFWQFDPFANAWFQKANLTLTGRSGSTGFAIEVAGRGYIGSGILITGSYTASFFEYNPYNDTWTQKASFPGGSRVGVTGFSVWNKGYFSFGKDFNANYYKDLWEYTPDSLTGVVELENMKVSIYPNPNNGIFMIEGQEGALEIYNSIGEIVYSNKITMQNTEIDLSSHPKGVYLVQMLLDDRVISRKILIQ